MAAAARTTTIRLGTGISLVPLHHPLRLAEEYAMLDALSKGRLEYGIGRGFLKYAYDVLGVDESESLARYQEGAELVLKAWTTSGAFSHCGQFWDVQDYTFFPPPIQQPHPPIYASGVVTPESFTWAGRHRLHLCSGFFVPNQEGVRNGIALYHQTLREYGYDPAVRDVAGVYQFYCGESNAEARQHGGAYVFNYFGFFNDLRRRSAFQSDAYQHHQPQGTGQGYSKLIYEDLDERNMIMIGDPDKLIERIRWAQNYFSTNYLIFEVAQGGMPRQYIIPSLERFSKEVMPAFR